jgi:hypothetical protein
MITNLKTGCAAAAAASSSFSSSITSALTSSSATRTNAFVGPLPPPALSTAPTTAAAVMLPLPKPRVKRTFANIVWPIDAEEERILRSDSPLIVPEVIVQRNERAVKSILKKTSTATSDAANGDLLNQTQASLSLLLTSNSVNTNMGGQMSCASSSRLLMPSSNSNGAAAAAIRARSADNNAGSGSTSRLTDSASMVVVELMNLETTTQTANVLNNTSRTTSMCSTTSVNLNSGTATPNKKRVDFLENFCFVNFFDINSNNSSEMLNINNRSETTNSPETDSENLAAT